jgi:hypothetical protein
VLAFLPPLVEPARLLHESVPVEGQIEQADQMSKHLVVVDVGIASACAGVFEADGGLLARNEFSIALITARRIMPSMIPKISGLLFAVRNAQSKTRSRQHDLVIGMGG